MMKPEEKNRRLKAIGADMREIKRLLEVLGDRVVHHAENMNDGDIAHIREVLAGLAGERG